MLNELYGNHRVAGSFSEIWMLVMKTNRLLSYVIGMQFRVKIKKEKLLDIFLNMCRSKCKSSFASRKKNWGKGEWGRGFEDILFWKTFWNFSFFNFTLGNFRQNKALPLEIPQILIRSTGNLKVKNQDHWNFSHLVCFSFLE